MDEATQAAIDALAAQQAKIDALAITVATFIEKVDASSASTQQLLQMGIFGAIVLALVYFLLRQQNQVSRNQEFTQDNTRQQMTVTQSATNELSLFRGMSTTALEIQVAGTKAAALVAEGVAALTTAITTLALANAGHTKSLETISSGQVAISLTTLSTDVKITKALQYLGDMRLDVREFIGGLNGQGYDIQKLAELAARPTAKAAEDVKEIADRPDAPAVTPVEALPETAGVTL